MNFLGQHDIWSLSSPYKWPKFSFDNFLLFFASCINLKFQKNHFWLMRHLGVNLQLKHNHAGVRWTPTRLDWGCIGSFMFGTIWGTPIPTKDFLGGFWGGRGGGFCKVGFGLGWPQAGYLDINNWRDHLVDSCIVLVYSLVILKCHMN